MYLGNRTIHNKQNDYKAFNNLIKKKKCLKTNTLFDFSM